MGLFGCNNGLYYYDTNVIQKVSLFPEEKGVSQSIIFDRGMDRPICRDFIIAEEGNFNLRLKKTTKVIYKSEEMAVNKISKKVPLFMKLTATRIQKNKKSQLVDECGAIKVQYKAKGKTHDLWLVVTKRTNGGYC